MSVATTESRAAIKAKVARILTEQMKGSPSLNDITSEKRLVADLGIDSMGLVLAGYHLEGEFGLPDRVLEEEIKSLVTVGDVVEYIKQRASTEP